ncbi:MAG: rhomboid family intramembrane serine protease [Chloroflexi bacterium]|nr:rhomboid family intramembrane serine protease [Chloroflexota bacterium]
MSQNPQLPDDGNMNSSTRRVAIKMPVVQPRVTFALLGVLALIFLYYLSLSPGVSGGQEAFLNDWAKVNDLVRDGEYYRLFTSMFVHLDMIHILFNGYALYLFGRDVESLFGHVRFGVIYFLGGLSGSLASFIFTDAPSVGASGAIFAIFGAEMVYFYQHRQLHGEAGRRHLNRLLFFMLLNLAFGFTYSRIDNAGHIGGLIGGVVLAWFIGPDYSVQRDPTTESGLSVVDDNPIQRWALPSVLYAVGLVVLSVYAISAPV